MYIIYFVCIKNKLYIIYLIFHFQKPYSSLMTFYIFIYILLFILMYLYI